MMAATRHLKAEGQTHQGEVQHHTQEQHDDGHLKAEGQTHQGEVQHHTQEQHDGSDQTLKAEGQDSVAAIMLFLSVMLNFSALRVQSLIRESSTSHSGTA